MSPVKDKYHPANFNQQIKTKYDNITSNISLTSVKYKYKQEKQQKEK